MKPAAKKYPDIPSDFEMFGELDFDFHLDPCDYIYLFFYLLLVGPFLLVRKMIQLSLGLFADKKQPGKTGKSRFAESRMYLYISKYF